MFFAKTINRNLQKPSTGTCKNHQQEPAKTINRNLQKPSIDKYTTQVNLGL